MELKQFLSLNEDDQIDYLDEIEDKEGKSDFALQLLESSSVNQSVKAELLECLSFWNISEKTDVIAAKIIEIKATNLVLGRQCLVALQNTDFHSEKVIKFIDDVVRNPKEDFETRDNGLTCLFEIYEGDKLDELADYLRLDPAMKETIERWES